MAINYASRASKKVSEAFYKESVTEGIFSHDYSWDGVATVEVYTVDTVALNNYNATLTSGSRFGALTELGDTLTPYTVNDDKSYNIAIDSRNNNSTLMIKAAGKAMSRQTREVVVPYVDQYRLTALATGNGLSGFGTAKASGGDGGTVVTGTSLSKSTVIDTLLNAGAVMSNLLVPKKGRVLYIGETEAIKVKLADQVIGVDKLAEKSIVNGVCGTVDGMQVRIIPDTWMPTGVVFMIVKQGCAVAPMKLKMARILNDHPDIDGHVLQARFLHDCFVLPNKADGIYVAKT